jgi:hypothetical protein
MSMGPTQLIEIQGYQHRLCMSDAELLQLVREIAPGSGCGVRSIADLDFDQSRQLIEALDGIERSEIGVRMKQREAVAT